MAHRIGIYYDEGALRSFMKSDKLGKMEDEIMQQKLSQVEAEFLNTFGTSGKFEIKAVVTNSRRSRLTYRISAADAKTGAILKREPGWLKRFVR